MRRLESFKTFPTRRTPEASLLALIEQLKPLNTGRSLLRLGPKGDGGYLVPDDLEEIEACFSPGVSTTTGFEEDCAKLGMKVFLADKSVNNPYLESTQYHFTKKYIGSFNNEEFITMDAWLKITNLNQVQN